MTKIVFLNKFDFYEKANLIASKIWKKWENFSNKLPTSISIWIILNKVNTVRMKRPQDSDIFGTKQLRIAPRIQNDEKIDPNAVFKAKMDKKYCTYANQLNPVHRTITQE